MESTNRSTDWGIVTLVIAGAFFEIIYMLTLPAVQQLIQVAFVAVCLPAGVKVVFSLRSRSVFLSSNSDSSSSNSTRRLWHLSLQAPTPL